MRGHYNPTRPLQTPAEGWPALSQQSAAGLARVADLLSAAAGFSASLDADGRFACLYDVLDRVGAEINGGELLELSVGSPDDPLALFCLDFAALCFILDEPSRKRMKRRLGKLNFGLPAGINPDDPRSKPLIALHRVIDLLDKTVGALVAAEGSEKTRSGAVH